MSQSKLTFDDFITNLNTTNLAFVLGLNEFMINHGCKATFEEKKTSILASYKHTKTKKSVINLLIKKQGLLVRIYGENISTYHDFLQTIPAEMVQAIDASGICKRLVSNGCSPKCIGYDFTIEGTHYQKCRYNCFEFLVTEESASYINTL